uniref:Uncharacterized protein n=1 Tax=Steinernema glaseri TaxID=37863 RepID=A0A1I7ZGW9_9BILA
MVKAISPTTEPTPTTPRSTMTQTRVWEQHFWCSSPQHTWYEKRSFSESGPVSEGIEWNAMCPKAPIMDKIDQSSYCPKERPFQLFAVRGQGSPLQIRLTCVYFYANDPTDLCHLRLSTSTQTVSRIVGSRYKRKFVGNERTFMTLSLSREIMEQEITMNPKFESEVQRTSLRYR